MHWHPWHAAPSHWHGFHRHWHYARRPSRLFWFLAGAVTATWISNRPYLHQKHAEHFNHCIRRVHEELKQEEDQQQAQQQSVQRWSHRWEWAWPPQSPPPPEPQPQPEQAQQPPPNPWPERQWGLALTPAQQEKLRQEEMERLAQLARKAGDAMSELSESTLDSVLKIVESLRNKIAEHRAEKERQDKQVQKELEDIKNNPPRLV